MADAWLILLRLQSARISSYKRTPKCTDRDEYSCFHTDTHAQKKTVQTIEHDIIKQGKIVGRGLMREGLPDKQIDQH